MAIQVQSSVVINGHKFRIVGNAFPLQIRSAGLGIWRVNNLSGLGNALKKAGFSQLQVKAVYALIRSL
jgi:hypothetical protein